MKNFIVTLFIFSFVGIYANTEKEANSSIKNVNVFLSRAEVSRTASTSVGKGMTDVILTNLSQNIDPNSIQVSGLGDVVIMSVSHRVNYLNKASESPKVKNLQNQIEVLNDSIVMLRYKKEALQEEKNMILTNKSIGGANVGVNWENLEYVADFFRERLTKISLLWTRLDKREKKNNKDLQDLNAQLRELTSSLNKPTSEIIVKVNSEQKTNLTLNFNYLVYNAGWTPLYDFRAEDGNDKIAVSMKANVYQNTGVDWSNVPLTLSTGNPSLGVTKPELNPWYINLQQLHIKYKKGGVAYQQMPSRAMQQLDFDKREDGWGDEVAMEEIPMAASNTISRSTAEFVNTNMKQLSTEYSISLKQNIPSDNKQHMVNIKEFDVSAFFKHAAVPKLDKDAFLMAHITDWQQYDWITSSINVFYDGTYVGKALLNVAEVEDTLSLSLGRDKKVVVEREKIKDYSHTKSFGLNKRKLIGYRITVRNNKKTTINLNLQDQIPVSKNEQVEVKVVDISKADQEAETGFLNWEEELKPGESKEFIIKFEVKYPRKYKVVGL